MWKPLWRYIKSFFVTEPERTYRFVSEMTEQETYDAFCILTGDVWPYRDVRVTGMRRKIGGYKFITIATKEVSLTAYIFDSGDVSVACDYSAYSVEMNLTDCKRYLKSINVEFNAKQESKAESGRVDSDNK